MINLESKSDGVVLLVKVQAGAKRNGIVGIHNGALKIAVNAAPERGKANQAVIEVLSNALSIPRSDIILVAGQTSRQKTFFICGVTAEQLIERIGEP